MKRVSMKKAESPIGFGWFSCAGKTCDRDNCLLRCHSLEEARKDPLIVEFTAKVKRRVLACNDMLEDNPTAEILDRCPNLEKAKEDPLVLELISKLKNEVFAKAGKTIYWEDVLKGNPKVVILLGHALLNELNVPRNPKLRKEILSDYRKVPTLLFYALLSQITNIPSCEVLSGQFEAKKKASTRDIYQKLVLDKRLK
ncbi:MAG: hypothetical protein QG575_1067 [Euryarchaeota archaeon]|nr:hypothetical protein [Euryarchaeota archaeon]